MNARSRCVSVVLVMAAAAAVTSSGCGDDEAPDRAVVRVEAASAASCPHGGTVVHSGLDRDGDDVLDDREIRKSAVICNELSAEPAPAVLVRLRDEPAGARCTSGGTAVQSGRDRNGNGALDDDEVERTDYACAYELLTRVTPEPAGARCTVAGARFDSGRDRDEDEVLDDAEIERTEYECEVIAGDVVLRTAADLATASTAAVISGSLTIEAAAPLEQLVLPRLRHLGGSLTVAGAASLRTLSLPALASVHGSVTLQGNPLLSSPSAPVLRRVDGDFAVIGNPALSTLNGLPLLAQVGGAYTLRDNSVLQSVTVPGKRVGGALEIANNDLLSSLFLTIQEPVGGVEIADNNTLFVVVLQGGAPAYVRIHDNATLHGISIFVLGDLSTPAALGEVLVRDNPALDSLSARADRISSLRIFGSPQLLSLDLSAAELGAPGSAVELRAGTRLATLSFFSTTPGLPIRFAGDLQISGALQTLFGLDLFDVAGHFTLEGTRLPAFTRLARVGGDLMLRQNTLLTSASFAALEHIGGGLRVLDNAALNQLQVPALQALSAVEVRGNVALPTCQATAICTRFPGASCAISGNDDSGTCQP